VKTIFICRFACWEGGDIGSLSYSFLNEIKHLGAIFKILDFRKKSPPHLAMSV